MELTSTKTTERLFSLDALRGFDMFWIMGAEEIVHALFKVTGSPFWGTISNELTHPDWNGFHFYDLIFPLFLFIAGVATPYSVGRELEKGKTKQQMLWRVVRRGLILVLLGIIYLYSKERMQIIWFCALLIGYWLLLKFTSAPGFPPGDLTMEGNFASYIDRSVLPGRLYLGIHDPEGLMSTIPAIGTGLLGILAGTLLKNSPVKPQIKALRLAITGI